MDSKYAFSEFTLLGTTLTDRGPVANSHFTQAGAVPASDFKARAVPLHVVVTHKPPAARDDNDASPAPVDDTDLLGVVALQPCSFTTGSYGWKGSKRLAIDLIDPTGGEKKKVQVMLTSVFQM